MGALSVCQPLDLLWLVWVRVKLLLLEIKGTYCWIIVLKRVFKGTKWAYIIFTIFATAKIRNVNFWVMKQCIRYSSGPSFASLSTLLGRLIHFTLRLHFLNVCSRRAESRTIVAVLEELLPSSSGWAKLYSSSQNVTQYVFLSDASHCACLQQTCRGGLIVIVRTKFVKKSGINWYGTL
jgi:hypothetical protein